MSVLKAGGLCSLMKGAGSVLASLRGCCYHAGQWEPHVQEGAKERTKQVLLRIPLGQRESESELEALLSKPPTWAWGCGVPEGLVLRPLLN